MVTAFASDPAVDRLLSSTEAAGWRTTNVYDDAGRLTGKFGPLAQVSAPPC